MLSNSFVNDLSIIFSDSCLSIEKVRTIFKTFCSQRYHKTISITFVKQWWATPIGNWETYDRETWTNIWRIHSTSSFVSHSAEVKCCPASASAQDCRQYFWKNARYNQWIFKTTNHINYQIDCHCPQEDFRKLAIFLNYFLYFSGSATVIEQKEKYFSKIQYLKHQPPKLHSKWMGR